MGSKVKQNAVESGANAAVDFWLSDDPNHENFLAMLRANSDFLKAADDYLAFFLKTEVFSRRADKRLAESDQSVFWLSFCDKLIELYNEHSGDTRFGVGAEQRVPARFWNSVGLAMLHKEGCFRPAVGASHDLAIRERKKITGERPHRVPAGFCYCQRLELACHLREGRLPSGLSAPLPSRILQTVPRIAVPDTPNLLGVGTAELGGGFPPQFEACPITVKLNRDGACVGVAVHGGDRGQVD
ncbi:MAG: YwqI/YxiC family protein [Gemmataceae bacterium]|nr:YwqI/YxiC family protein [Gemmataceae bacterium]